MWPGSEMLSQLRRLLIAWAGPAWPGRLSWPTPIGPAPLASYWLPAHPGASAMTTGLARLAGPGRIIKGRLKHAAERRERIATSHVQELNAASVALADASSLSHTAPFLQDRKCIAKVIARLSFRVGPKLKLKFEIE